MLNQYLNFETFEVNSYETNDGIDKMIQQTVNQNQINLVTLQAGNSATINVDVNQDLLGTNASAG